MHVLMLDQRLAFFRASCKREQGQTMAEYGDVGFQGAISRVIGIVPG